LWIALSLAAPHQVLQPYGNPLLLYVAYTP